MIDSEFADKNTAPNTCEETPFFYDSGSFGVVHRPQGAGAPGWVICSPFGKERDRTNRLVFEWARVLAAEGYWALKFDYRGTGDSAGRFGDFTVHNYVEDISRAVAELERISGMPCRGVIGLRLGADLAAIVASEFDRPLELVMWEPVVDGDRYRNSLLRTAMANEMVVSKGSHRSRNDFRRELEAGRSVSVDGFSMSPRMYDSLLRVKSAGLERSTSASTLIIQMTTARGRAPKRSVLKLYEVYTEGGLTRLESVQASPVWMETKSFRWSPDELFGKTLGWMEEREPESVTTGAPVGPASGSCRCGTSTERPIGFEVQGERVWGILHKASNPREGVSNIVMVAAGDVCRAGFFYPQLARNLAEGGWNVLRFDPRGLGDSHGDQRCEWLIEFFDKVENGVLVPDTVAALDFMERECGSRASVLIGLCGGAITSVFSAQLDDRVVGIVPLDLPITLFRPARWDSKEVSWIGVFSKRRSTLFLVRAYLFCRLLKKKGVGFGHAVSGVFSKPRQRVDTPDNRRLYAEKIGENANFPLLAAIEKSLERGIPMFCAFAESSEHWPKFDTLSPSLRETRPQAESLINFRVIEGADHNFMMPGCTENLMDALNLWLDDPQIPWVRGHGPTRRGLHD